MRRGLSGARRRLRLRERGFAIISAIFLLVVLAGLAAYLVNVSTTQSINSAQDVDGSRAYHAARAGTEWGLYQVLDPGNATVVPPASAAWPNMPGCPLAAVLPLEGFNVAVTCAVAGNYFEAGNNRRIRVYQIVATASRGVVGSSGYIERQLAVTASLCRARDGAAPSQACP